MKQNCWEFKQCGREPFGRNVGELGVCPAAVENKLHGVHDGKNGGRSCWVVPGTICKGKIQGTFAQKFGGCMECDFYQSVQAENFGNFQVTTALLNKLRQPSMGL